MVPLLLFMRLPFFQKIRTFSAELGLLELLLLLKIFVCICFSIYDWQRSTDICWFTRTALYCIWNELHSHLLKLLHPYILITSPAFHFCTVEFILSFCLVFLSNVAMINLFVIAFRRASVCNLDFRFSRWLYVRGVLRYGFVAVSSVAGETNPHFWWGDGG